MTDGYATMEIVKRVGSRPFPPRVSAFSRPFWDALNEGRLTSTSCNNCGRLSFPPKPVCRACWSTEIVWRNVATGGTLYSFTHIGVLPGAFVNDGLHDIGIVDLADGLRLMCRLYGDYETLRPDMPVEMLVLMYDDGPLFAARPAGK